MKDLVEVLLKRRSIRKYKDAAVAEEKLERILQAALLAPSSRGKTPWEFVVVQDKAMLQELSLIHI